MDLVQGKPCKKLTCILVSANTTPDWASYLLSSDSPVRPYLAYALSYSSYVRAYTMPIMNAVTQKPDLATIALLLVILFLSLKLLNMLWQAVMFWVRLAYRIVFWGGLAAMALWMWTRGPDGVMEDLNTLAMAWGEEYKYWKEREGMARGNQQPYGRGMPQRGSRW